MVNKQEDSQSGLRVAGAIDEIASDCFVFLRFPFPLDEIEGIVKDTYHTIPPPNVS